MNIRICKTINSIILIVALLFAGLFNWAFYSENVFGASVEKTETKIFYHLDLGVQLAQKYENGQWENEIEYGEDYYTNLSYTIEKLGSVDREFDVKKVYAYDGNNFPFELYSTGYASVNGKYITQKDFNEAYGEYFSTDIKDVTGLKSGDTGVSFSYSAFAEAFTPLEVYEAGENGNDEMIYDLFGGEEYFKDAYPVNYNAVSSALEAGRNGKKGSKALYLIFCPIVIEYSELVTEIVEVGALEAKLSAPSKVKQNEKFEVSDVSIVEEALEVDYAVVERKIDGGVYSEIVRWQGNGLNGSNTGGVINESFTDVCTVTYRLTVYTTEGLSDFCETIVNIVDGRQMSGEADLVLPEETYVGWSEIAKDYSGFTVDGEYYSSERAYEEKIAKNKFKIVQGSGGSIRKISNTKAEVVFDEEGIFTVKLEVSVGDSTLYDMENIKVKPTPEVLCDLGGIQKQNRKQILSIKVATTPGEPITDWYILLRDKTTGEEVRITEENPLVEGSNIKTRAVKKDTNDECITYFNLEFLTKTPVYSEEGKNKGEFEYEVYAEDTKGDNDVTSGVFSVVADEPPKAQIEIEELFLRESGSNTAKIKIKDSTVMSDGDQVDRVWSINQRDPLTDMTTSDFVTVGEDTPGYKDKSFGTGQEIEFNKESVGGFDIKILVQEKWNEETLEEYVTEADYLTSCAVSNSKVGNVSPIISLTPVS